MTPIQTFQRLRPAARKIITDYARRRGIAPDGLNEFLHPNLRLERGPLPQIEQFIGRLTSAVKNQEVILIFGDYDADLVCFEDRSLFPDEVEPGMQFEGLPEGATTPEMPDDAIYTVTEVYPSQVVLDANHPLAGIALRLHLTVRGVREATEEEIEAGSVNDSAAFSVLNTVPPAPGVH